MPTFMVEFDQFMSWESLRVQERGHQLSGTETFAASYKDADGHFAFARNTFGVNLVQPVVGTKRFQSFWFGLGHKRDQEMDLLLEKLKKNSLAVEPGVENKKRFHPQR